MTFTPMELEFIILKTYAKYAEEIKDTNPEKSLSMMETVWRVLLDQEEIEKCKIEERHLKLIK
jgi:hypothetical protein